MCLYKWFKSNLLDHENFQGYPFARDENEIDWQQSKELSRDIQWWSRA